MGTLLWESFFIGRNEVKSKPSFSDLSLCFEGFSFWYSDVIITQIFRSMAPNGDFVVSRSSAFQFHPGSVLKALNLKLDQGMDIYTTSFCGKKTRLLNDKNPYANELIRTVYLFYADKIKSLHKAYGVLKRVGIFDSYYKRFCKIENLPTFLPSEFPSPLGDPRAYCRAIYHKALPHLDKFNSRQVEQIRLRRHLQLRAYYATCLLYALEQRQFICNKSPKTLNVKQMCQGIEGLFRTDRKASSLSLPRGRKSKEIFAESQSHDLMFNHKVRKGLLEK